MFFCQLSFPQHNKAGRAGQAVIIKQDWGPRLTVGNSFASSHASVHSGCRPTRDVLLTEQLPNGELGHPGPIHWPVDLFMIFHLLANNHQLCFCGLFYTFGSIFACISSPSSIYHLLPIGYFISPRNAIRAMKTKSMSLQSSIINTSHATKMEPTSLQSLKIVPRKNRLVKHRQGIQALHGERDFSGLLRETWTIAESMVDSAITCNASIPSGQGN